MRRGRGHRGVQHDQVAATDGERDERHRRHRARRLVALEAQRDLDRLAAPSFDGLGGRGVAAPLDPDLVVSGREVQRFERRRPHGLAVHAHERVRGLGAHAQLGGERLHDEPQGQERLAVADLEGEAGGRVAVAGDAHHVDAGADGEPAPPATGPRSARRGRRRRPADPSRCAGRPDVTAVAGGGGSGAEPRATYSAIRPAARPAPASAEPAAARARVRRGSPAPAPTAGRSSPARP